MPLFVSEAELSALGHDAAAIASKADEFIRGVLAQLDEEKARANAAEINAEQTCSVIEQKYMSVTHEMRVLEEEKGRMALEAEKLASALKEAGEKYRKLEEEFSQARNVKNEHESTISELNSMRKRLMDVVDRKESELEEKNSSINLYLDKITALTNEKISLEEKLLSADASVSRSKALLTRVNQEKDLLEQHNNWLKEEINSKTNALFTERRNNGDIISELKEKLSLAEEENKSKNESLNRAKDRIKDLENRVEDILLELNSVKKNYADQENHLIDELETAKKLASLYKETSEENLKKASELEGVTKAFEVHLKQKDDEWEQKLNQREEIFKEYEKKVNDEYARLNDELTSAKEDIKKLTGTLTPKEPTFLLTSKSVLKPLTDELIQKLNEERDNPSTYHSYLSGPALAAALIKDGWTITTMYEKYEEVSEALREKEKSYKELETFFNQIVDHVEHNARIVLEEREEHEKLVSAYNSLESKLHSLNEEKKIFDYNLIDAKANLIRKERQLNFIEKELKDSQHQNTLYIKKIQELEQRRLPKSLSAETNKSFLEIKSLIEENSKLRMEIEDLKVEKDELITKMEAEYSSKIIIFERENEKLLSKLVEQSHQHDEVVASQKFTMDLYKRLYEESQHESGKLVQSPTSSLEVNYKSLYDSSQEELKILKEESTKHINQLQQQVEKFREDSFNSRLEKARIDGDMKFLSEKLEKVTMDAENQRLEMESVLRRNIEFSETITQYQHRLRENEINAQMAEEKSRKYAAEVAVLSKEKDLISISEKRSSEEVEKLSSRVYKLKASLEAAQSALEVKEASWLSERKKIDEDCIRYQKEWADAKKEIELEKNHLSSVILERDSISQELNEKIQILNSSIQQLQIALSKAETRSEDLQIRCNDLEEQLKKENEKISLLLSGGKDKNINEKEEILRLKDGFENLKNENSLLQDNLVSEKNHSSRWKEIAQANEKALTQVTDELKNIKQAADASEQNFLDTKNELEKKILDFESLLQEKESSKTEIINEIKMQLEQKNVALQKLTQAYELSKKDVEERNARIKSIEESNKENYQKWKESQANYERQVLMQGNTIRELSKVSEKLLELESKEKNYLNRAELAEYELTNSKTQWETLKSNFDKERAEFATKIKELENQNRILLDRIEAMNISSSNKTEILSEDITLLTESKTESDLQQVIHYLRRSKETLETELSLLTQERNRILKQLELTSKDAEEARNRLKSEQDRLKSNIMNEDEFNRLKSQVEQMNLLRESNHTLRLENQRNFEECQSFKERVKVAEEKIQPLEKELGNKELAIEMHMKEIQSLRSNCDMWQSRVRDLLEKYHGVNLEEYDQMKKDIEENSKIIQDFKQKLTVSERQFSESQDQIKNLQNELHDKSNAITSLKQKLDEKEITISKSEEKINELTPKLNELDIKLKESDDKLKLLNEKLKAKESIEEKFNSANNSADDYKKKFESVRRIAVIKRKECEELTKQKEDLTSSNTKLKNENEELKKTIEEKDKKSEEDNKIALQNKQASAASASKEEKLLQGRIKTLQENFSKFRQRTSLFHQVLEKANLKFNEIQSKQASFDLWIEEQKRVQGEGFLEPSQKSELDKVLEEGEVILKQTRDAFTALENESLISSLPAPLPPLSTPGIPPTTSTVGSLTSSPLPPSIALSTIPPSTSVSPASTVILPQAAELFDTKKDEEKAIVATESAAIEKGGVNEIHKTKDKSEEIRKVLETERKLRERLLAEKANRKSSVRDETDKKEDDEKVKTKEKDEERKELNSESLELAQPNKDETFSEEKKETEEAKPVEEVPSSRIPRIRRINRPKFEASSDENPNITEIINHATTTETTPPTEKPRLLETETEKFLEQNITVSEVKQSSDIVTASTINTQSTRPVSENVVLTTTTTKSTEVDSVVLSEISSSKKRPLESAENDSVKDENAEVEIETETSERFVKRAKSGQVSTEGIPREDKEVEIRNKITEPEAVEETIKVELEEGEIPNEEENETVHVQESIHEPVVSRISREGDEKEEQKEIEFSVSHPFEDSTEMEKASEIIKEETEKNDEMENEKDLDEIFEPQKEEILEATELNNADENVNDIIDETVGGNAELEDAHTSRKRSAYTEELEENKRAKIEMGQEEKDGDEELTAEEEAIGQWKDDGLNQEEEDDNLKGEEELIQEMEREGRDGDGDENEDNEEKEKGDFENNELKGESNEKGKEISKEDTSTPDSEIEKGPETPAGRIIHISDPISAETKSGANLNLASSSKPASESMEQILKRRASKFGPISPAHRRTSTTHQESTSSSIATRTRSKLSSPKPPAPRSKNEKEKGDGNQE